MAISSPLNPGVIAPERRVTPEKAQNFISGGAPLGSSVLSAAANKIVGFQRGAAAVAPRPPDLGSIIQTLSSNILNNVESKVQTINQTVNQIVNERIADLTSGYRDKIAKVDASLPNKLLNSFLTLYNKAIGYLQFFADRKNVSRLGDNLKALQEVFNETFKVAQIIRKQIVRIVDQLSNLPTASAGGGPGLNIDVDVPGGGLRRSAPSGLMRMMRRRPGMMLAGAGALGAGGAMVTSALAGPGAVQAEPTQDSGGLTGQYLDKFNLILSKFQSAIDDLTKPREKSSGGGGGGGSQSTTKKPTASTGAGPGAAPGGPATMPGTDQDLYTLATIAGLESGSAQGQADVAQAVYNRMSKGGKSATDILTAHGQFEPAFTAPYKISGGTVDPAAKNIKTFDDAVNYRMKKTGESKQKAEAAIKSTIANLQNQQLQQSAASFIGARTSFRGSPQNVGKLSNTVWRGSRSDNQFLNEEVAKGTAAVPSFVAGTGKPGTVAQVAPGKPQQTTVAAAPTQQQTQQQIAQQVSQPPATVQNNIVEMLNPVNMSQSMDQQGGVQTVDSGTVQGGTVPFLVSTNEDNFLTLYSKIVYNIVDG